MPNLMLTAHRVPAWRSAIHLVILLLGLASPAYAQDKSRPTTNDPFEPYNRAIYRLNALLVAMLPGPSMTDYQEAVPASVRQGLSNVFINLREPIAAVSALVGGNVNSARNSASRFAINTTLGLLGTRDVAAEMGYPAERNDAGLELCRNGILRESTFVELPILGPGDLRDIGAQIATNVALYTLVGGYVFYPYYVLDRLDMYLERATAAASAMPVNDPYAAKRDSYLAERRQRCDALTATVDKP